MPTFCRHNRFVENCPICARQERPRASATPSARRSASPGAGGSAAGAGAGKRPARPRRSGGDLRVRRVARAADDGYANELVPGLRASDDARRLAAEVAFSVARLAELREDPPGLLADISLDDDRERGLGLAFLVAYLSPLEAEDPWASIRAAQPAWAAGQLPEVDAAQLGPRTAHAPGRGATTLAAYRVWAARAGGQAAALAGEAAWTPQRRFDRAFERLALPGLTRAARYELLVLCSWLGVAEITAGSLLLSEPTDPAMLAAKRVFGMGDALILRRRSGELAQALDVPVEALDLALVNWAQPPGTARVTAGSRAQPDPDATALFAGVLGQPGEG